MLPPDRDDPEVPGIPPQIYGGEVVFLTPRRRRQRQGRGRERLTEWLESAIDDPLPSATLQVAFKLAYNPQAPRVERKPLGFLPRWHDIISGILRVSSAKIEDVQRVPPTKIDDILVCFSDFLTPMSLHFLPPTAGPCM